MSRVVTGVHGKIRIHNSTLEYEIRNVLSFKKGNNLKYDNNKK